MTTANKLPPGRAIAIANRADLLRAVQISSVVETRNTIPILSNMVIESGADGVALTATDLDIEIKVMLPARCEGEPLATTVAAKRFATLISSSDEGCQISLTHDAGGRDVELKAARGKYKMPALAREDFPLIAFEVGKTGFTITGKTLATALSRTAFAEEDNVGSFLCGTLLTAIDGRLIAVATNRHVLAEIDLMDAPTNWSPTILPRKLTGLLARLLKDVDSDVVVALDENHSRVRFSWADWTITSKLIVGEYPAWRRVIPEPNEARRVTVDSSQLQRASRRVAQVADEKRHVVIVALDEDKVTVSGQSLDLGVGEEELPASCPVTAFRFGVNHKYLHDIAAAASADSVAIEVSEDPEKPVRIEPQAGGGFVGILMPMRI